MSLSVMSSSLIHAVARVEISFKVEWYSIVWRYHVWLIHPSMDGQLGPLLLLAILYQVLEVCSQASVLISTSRVSPGVESHGLLWEESKMVNNEGFPYSLVKKKVKPMAGRL